jgi:hypothetical protein
MALCFRALAVVRMMSQWEERVRQREEKTPPISLDLCLVHFDVSRHHQHITALTRLLPSTSFTQS